MSRLGSSSRFSRQGSNTGLKKPEFGIVLDVVTNVDSDSIFDFDFDIENKARVQKKLIKNACNLIKKNGILIYSTCSLEKKEDEEIVEYAKKLGFKVLYEKKYWPHIENTIGFYMAKLEYIGS